MYGVTDNGFIIKDSDTIRAEITASFKASYGNDIDTTSSSVLGQLIEMQTQGTLNIWEVMQAVYNIRDLNGAEGINLDILLAINNFLRQAAVRSSASVICSGDYNTEITEGSIVKQSISGKEFLIETTASLDNTGLYSVDLELSAESVETSITIEINTVEVTFTSIVDTIENMVNDLVNKINASTELIGDLELNEILVAENIDGLLNIKQVLYQSNYLFDIAIIANAGYISCGKQYTVNCIEFGPVIVEENSIDTIVTNISGWDTVINYEAGTTGRVVESDTDFRLRYKQFINFIGNATEDAIAANLILLDEIYSAIVKSNRSDFEDEAGMPPHSFEAIVITNTVYDPPESIPTVTRDIIAQRIWDTMPAGIQTYSRNVPEISGQAIDVDGNVHEILFSLPIQVPIYCDINYTVDEEKANPDHNIDIRKSNIKQVITNYVNNNFKLNEDVYATRLYRPLYEIREIGAVTNFKVGKSAPATETFISILENEYARLDSDRITITQDN